jgi:hypothetical protein
MTQHLAGRKHQEMLQGYDANAPNCKCKQRSVKRIVQKEGLTKGRPFYGCNSQSCNFFKWADDDSSDKLLAASKKRNRSVFEDSDTYERGEKFVISRSKQDATNDNPFGDIQAYKDKFVKRRVLFSNLPNGDCEVEFSYDRSLIDIIKTHIAGRSYNPNDHTWTIPHNSLPQAIALFTFLGVKVPQKMDKIMKNYTPGASTDVITIERLKVTSVVSFQYKPDIVNCAKMIHPHQRTYDPYKKNWIISLAALPQFVETIRHVGYDLVPLALQQLVDQIEQGGGELTKALEEELEREAAKRVKLIQVPCDCGRPDIKIGKMHVCRYYGHFNCDKCHNPWNSAYTWRDETQLCRGCGHEQLPWKKDPLKKREGMPNNCVGEHDSSRCSMYKAWS